MAVPFVTMKKAIDNMVAGGMESGAARAKLQTMTDAEILAAAVAVPDAVRSGKDQATTAENGKRTEKKITTKEKKELHILEETPTAETAPQIVEKLPEPPQMLEVVKGEEVPAVEEVEGIEEPEKILPEGLADLLYSTVDGFTKMHKLDRMDKCRQTAWSACCQYIGRTIFRRNRKLLADKPPKNGGFQYDLRKLCAMADIWGHMCGIYGKAPFVDDFANFCGMDATTFYANSGKYKQMEPNPLRVRLIQKVQGMQELGLAGLIVDGKQNPTGALAALNHWHGWTQSREIVHISAAAAPALDDIPQIGVKN